MTLCILHRKSNILRYSDSRQLTKLSSIFCQIYWVTYPCLPLCFYVHKDIFGQRLKCQVLILAALSVRRLWPGISAHCSQNLLWELKGCLLGLWKVFSSIVEMLNKYPVPWTRCIIGYRDAWNCSRHILTRRGKKKAEPSCRVW